MFVKTAKFKKLLKEAYSGSGLHIGNMGDGIMIAGSYWMMWVRGGMYPERKTGSHH